MTVPEPQTFLQLDGPLTVPRAEAIQAMLLAALDARQPVVLDVSGATDIDVSFLQILVAAQKSATVQGTSLALRRDGATLLMNEAERCGLSATSMLNGTRVLPRFVEGNA